jgi:voltage-gated potassium channel
VFLPEKLRHKLHEIIHEADTPAGKAFDLAVLAVIIISVAAVMLESVESISQSYGRELQILEWIITVFFTIEYVSRALTVKRPLKYMLSFYGLTDLLATLPGYLDLFFPGSRTLLSVRAIRLLRVFRILKLAQFVGAANILKTALYNSRIKIGVFLFAVVVLCVIMGTIMYLVEGPDNGFANIPISVYWTIVTLTTVGFGDITPHTPLGMFIANIIMILGYGIIAVPTGIVTAEMAGMNKDSNNNTQACPDCGRGNHRDNAEFCFSCGARLHN